MGKAFSTRLNAWNTLHEVRNLFLQQWKNNQEKEEHASHHHDKHNGDRQSPVDMPLTDADFFQPVDKRITQIRQLLPSNKGRQDFIDFAAQADDNRLASSGQ